ncbi:MAG: 5-methyltetrahydropteroyltriglutamate--homocysteine S-methyltransferase [Alphaproteobacteria bacterium]|nr:MAG: 5-methyltetrahydropteroyltriglutamate--homocysteine S-methyltransferase [Alphaproteobacteria bacterium]
MQRTKPPYRADQVGSFLRSGALKEARAKHEKGQISAADLKKVEDGEIEKLIRQQEAIGMQLVTDGEYRRAWWHFDFLEGLDGVEGYEAEHGIQFAGVETKARGVKVTGKVAFSNHPFLEHFRFVKEHTKVTPKMTIPSPSVLHFRGGRKGISKTVYPELDAFFDDLATAYKDAVAGFYQAGCRYLQFDDTVWAYLCSQKEMEQARQRGDDPSNLQQTYARVINEAIEDRPADMTITTHVCRGNFRSTWISEGGYEPVAETLFGKVNYDGYFLEYDTERAGGFEPLRFVPKGNKQIVLGLVTSKSGTLEKKDDIKRRIDEASKYVAPEQLCLSPQCGFASTEEGNVLTEEAQWNKMRMIKELSQEVWG